MSTVLITGGTGLIGKALTAALLERGYSVIILTRKLPPEGVLRTNDEPYPTQADQLTYALWDIEKQAIDHNAISRADYIIHLAGASVAEKRWSTKRKNEIVESRTNSSALLVKALSESDNKVKAVISASGIGWYGSPASVLSETKGTMKNPFIETDPPAEDFLGETCRRWEASIEPAALMGKRLVKFRTGIVLSSEGGALSEFKKPLRFGLATILGSGKQIISWIHIDDVVRLFMYAIENEELAGVYNAVAPRPVTNKELMLALARKLKGKFFIAVHVPSFLLSLVLGEMSIKVLESAFVSSAKIQDAGFIFQYPAVGPAIRQLSDPKNPPG
jgi:uncharacterized protein